MSTVLRKSCSREEFFTWAQQQEGRYELEGGQPRAMTGGTLAQAMITHNLQLALGLRLRGTRWRALGQDAGVATTAGTVRYPDSLIVTVPQDRRARTAHGVVVIFEVLSESTAQVDRKQKVSEYAAVPSILRYVLIESSAVGLQVLERPAAPGGWRSSTLGLQEILAIPEARIEIPVQEIYEGIDFEDREPA